MVPNISAVKTCTVMERVLSYVRYGGKTLFCPPTGQRTSRGSRRIAEAAEAQNYFLAHASHNDFREDVSDDAKSMSTGTGTELLLAVRDPRSRAC